VEGFSDSRFSPSKVIDYKYSFAGIFNLDCYIRRIWPGKFWLSSYALNAIGNVNERVPVFVSISLFREVEQILGKDVISF
jgi:hypothetical protein